MTKYILTLLLLAGLAQAGSFTIPIQMDGYSKGTGGSFGAVRALTQTVTNNIYSADSSIIGIGKTGATWALWRSRMMSDTINQDASGNGGYLDSCVVTSGYSLQLDSIRLTIRAMDALDSSGCTGYLFCYVFDTCASGRNFNPSVITSGAYFNDYLTYPTGLNDAFLMDSVLVDTNVIGMGKSGDLTFTLTDRTKLDEVECLMGINSATSNAMRFDIVACYDKDSVDNVSGDPFKFKVEFATVETANDPYLTVWWSEIAPSSVGVRSQVNEISSFVRSRLR